MSEALKDIYNKQFLIDFSEKVYSAYKNFDKKGFLDMVLDDNWNDLKLRARMMRIAETLGKYLPQEYEEALQVLFSIDEDCIGFPYLFFPDFVAFHGESDKNWDISMKALERFTKRSSSEFAVRPFFKRNPEKMINQMLEWSKSENEHVRRLSSEGCRPRLPWGEALTMFKKDPKPVILVLEELKEDPSLYVRKSVANNLNDISKDNQRIFIDILKRWKGKNKDTDWILRHASRTLIRKSNPEVMSLFGYDMGGDGAVVTEASLTVDSFILNIGDSCRINYEVFIGKENPVHIRVEYGIDFVKANGKTSRKLFLLSDKSVAGGERISGTRIHKWHNLTTRKHYSGEHKIALLVNGNEVACTVIELEDMAMLK
jgi:3-methyladenine DNA glycosylase AlkC